MRRLPIQDNVPQSIPPFADRLQDGERLLWEGRPDIRVFIRSGRIEVAWLMLPLIPGILLLECAVCWGSIPWTSAVIWACPIISWLVGYLVFSGQISAQGQTAAYAFSDRRLFIRRLEWLTSKDTRPRVDEIPLQTVQPHLRLLGGGFGTITLGASWVTVYNTQRILRAVPDAATVFGLLIEAQAAIPMTSLTETRVLEPYYTKPSTLAQLVPRWKTEGFLRHGETILWQGTVDAEADLRAGWWAIPLLAGIIALIGGYILWMLGIWTWLWQALVFAGSIPIVLLVARSDRRTFSDRCPQYILTKRRVLIVKNGNKPQPEIEERDLSEVRAMRLKRERGGFGTVVFEKKIRFVWQGYGSTIETYEFSFEHIADAEAVFGQIRDAAAGYN